MPVELMPPMILSFASVVIAATGRAAPTKWIWPGPVPPGAAAKITVSPAPTTSEAAVSVARVERRLAAGGDLVERGRGLAGALGAASTGPRLPVPDLRAVRRERRAAAAQLDDGARGVGGGDDAGDAAGDGAGLVEQMCGRRARTAGPRRRASARSTGRARPCGGRSVRARSRRQGSRAAADSRRARRGSRRAPMRDLRSAVANQKRRPPVRSSSEGREKDDTRERRTVGGERSCHSGCAPTVWRSIARPGVLLLLLLLFDSRLSSLRCVLICSQLARRSASHPDQSSSSSSIRWRVGRRRPLRRPPWSRPSALRPARRGSPRGLRRGSGDLATTVTC